MMIDYDFILNQIYLKICSLGLITTLLLITRRLY
jgi:hypothetical protein